MSNEEKAKYLARELFALGDFAAINDKTQRIQFMGGTYPDAETGLGGMCEEALIKFFTARLNTLEQL